MSEDEDLVTRLRYDCDIMGDWICGDAADEIIRLRAELTAERERANANEALLFDALRVTAEAEGQRDAELAALEYVGERIHRIYWLAGLDAPIREQAQMAKDAIATALAAADAILKGAGNE